MLCSDTGQVLERHTEHSGWPIFFPCPTEHICLSYPTLQVSYPMSRTSC